MIAYENNYELCITLPAGEGLQEGDFCAFCQETGNVIPAAGGEDFFGIAKSVRNGLACVMVRGIATVYAGGEHYELGWGNYCVDGKTMQYGGTSRVLVLKMDGAAKTVTIML